ncbi:hypothetical protein KGQ20_18555 [Catenulispora sp. NF23]|uniref:hypothetical protein n=1 Tax=Catenulispora pinistramenti TaxID=2705254 RepID=UPI001BA62B62|nr:hypothetical protein [Catenulispora pinistramenti]MBS2534775.1 hypothetical protein [Catenulispora pinistramenti]
MAHRIRSIASALLLTLAALLAPLAVASVWMADELGDTDRYVATVAPLATDPVVQNAVTTQVTTAIVSRLDVKGLVGAVTGALTSAAPSQPKLGSTLQNLSGALTGGITDFVQQAVHQVVTSSAFPSLWNQANRAAHTVLMDALTGSSGVIGTGDGQVTISLAPIEDAAKQQLAAAGFPAAADIPDINATFVVAQTDALHRARTVFNVVQVFGNWLPLIVVVLFVAGVLLAVRRRRAFGYGQLAIAVTCALVGVGLWIGRHVYRDHLPSGVDADAAMLLYDTVVRFLRTTVRTIAVLALVLALGAYFTGPAAFARHIRALCKAVIGHGRALTRRVGMSTGPVGPWVNRHRRAVSAAVVGVALIAFLLYDDASGTAVLTFAALLLAALALVEFLDPGDPAAASPISG